MLRAAICDDESVILSMMKSSIEKTFLQIDCQVKCNRIREKNFEAPRRESEN